MLYPSVNNLFEDVFDGDFFERHDLTPSRFGRHVGKLAAMRADIKETKNAYKIAIDLPGCEKEDIKITLTQGILTVSAEKKSELEEKDEEQKLIRSERYVGVNSRSWFVGEDIKQEDIKAKYKNGVLNLTIAKPAEEIKANEVNNITIE